MNEIKVNVSFEKRVLNVEGINLVTGDYNSTKLSFVFDKEYEGRKVFEIAKPYDKDQTGQAIFVKEIENNEVTLVAYDENGKEVSIFSVEGRHPFEISLYNGNSKLTSMYGILGVSKEAVKVGDEVVERYIPIFDDLMNKANTIIDNLEASEKDIQDAEATRNENEKVRVKDEVIRSVNEDNRKAAEENRSKAEADRATAEDARNTAEETRQENETSRVNSETARNKAETTRSEAEETRNDNETTRTQNEESRVKAEADRTKSEEDRKTAENSRTEAEKNRATAETKRVEAENLRADAEEARNEAETTRVNAEKARDEAETTRNEAETTRNNNETAREEAETTRNENESTRIANEIMRQEKDKMINSILKDITVEGSNIHIKDSAYWHAKVGVFGKSEQETRSGRNLYNVEDTRQVSSGATLDENGWIKATYDNTNSTSAIFINYYTNNLNLKTNTEYKVFFEIKEISGQGIFFPVSTNTSGGQFNSSYSYNFSDLQNGAIRAKTIITKSDFTNITNGLRTFIQFEAGQSGSITFRISVLEDTTITADTFEYEQYGAMPSFEFPSPVKSVGDNINILPYPFENTTKTVSGITFTDNGDGTITANGTATGTAYFNLSKPTLSKGSYYISGIPSGASGTTYEIKFGVKNYYSNGTFNVTDESFTPSESYIKINSGVTVHNLVFKPKMEKGSKASPYSPYGKGSVEVGFSNKNSFDIDKFKEQNPNATITGTNENFYYSYQDKSGYYDYKFKENTQYVFSGIWSTTYGNLQAIIWYTDGTLERFFEKWDKSIVDDTSFKVISAANKTVQRLEFNTYHSQGNFTLKNFQIEESTVATDYEPHQLQTYPLHLSKELNGDETVRDRPVKIDGKWFYEFNWGKLILDGTYNWAIRADVSNDKTYCFRLLAGEGIFDNMKEGTGVYCNYLKCENNANDYEHIRYIGANGYRIQPVLDKTIFTSADVLKTKLQELYNAGVPLYIIYQLAEPIYEEITDQTLIAQLDAMEEKAKTYQTVTNITSDAHLEVTYKKDLQTQINEVLSLTLESGV